MTECTHPRSKGAKRCRACQFAHMTGDRDIAARRLAAIKAHHAKPEVKLANRERLRLMMADKMQDPAEVERRREHGRRQYRDFLSRPDVMAKTLSPEVRKRASEKRTATMLRDIPASMRGEYLELVRSKNVNAAEAKAIILDQWKKQIAARAA